MAPAAPAELESSLQELAEEVAEDRREEGEAEPAGDEEEGQGEVAVGGLGALEAGDRPGVLDGDLVGGEDGDLGAVVCQLGGWGRGAVEKVTAADIRAAFAYVIAAAAAAGPSILHGVHHLERGYDHVFEKFSELGLGIRQLRD